MIVNGFRLPKAFVQLCEAIQRGEAPVYWELKDEVDAYGHPWTNFGLVLFTDPDRIAQETRTMDWRFREDQRLQQHEEARDEPGFIQDFSGVANYVQFGTSNTGEAYCFDFDGAPREPSVVTWPELNCYWRRVAPNFDAFMALFGDADEVGDGRDDEIPLPGNEGWEVSRVPPGTLLAVHVKHYVQTEDEGSRVLFVVLQDDYEECSPAERVAAEAQVRSELEAEGMPDTQRQRLNEVWARLHATEQA
jgi:hypothetical protein